MCILSPKLINRFLNHFYSENWDPYVNFEYRTNFVLFSGAEKFTKQNIVVVDKYIFILTWSCPHITRVVLRWPDGLLTGPIITSEPLRGPKLPQLVSQGVSGPLSGQSGHLKATLRQWGPLQVSINMYLSISEPGFVLQISQPPKIAQNWFCIQNLHKDLSFQKKTSTILEQDLQSWC